MMATLIPLLTLGIPGDGCVAIMLSALMINGLNPGLSLFTTDGPIIDVYKRQGRRCA